MDPMRQLGEVMIVASVRKALEPDGRLSWAGGRTVRDPLKDVTSDVGIHVPGEDEEQA